MGTYWADISSPHVSSVVENSDLMIFAGAVLNDYTTVGWTALINPKTSIEMFPFKVIVCGKLYMKVALADLMRALAAKAPKKEVKLTPSVCVLLSISTMLKCHIIDLNATFFIKGHCLAMKFKYLNLLYLLISSVSSVH